jgi:predicted CXXCH cytochrome family protein
LEQCGQCHAAHGSTAKAHLILPRDKACGLCHSTPSQN